MPKWLRDSAFRAILAVLRQQRLVAVQQLGWRTIPTVYVELDEVFGGW